MDMQSSTDAVDAPLTGIRVVEIVTGPMALTGRLFADLGADVVQIRLGSSIPEPTVLSRRLIEDIALGRGKRTLLLDPDTPSDREILAPMIAQCDILIEDGRALETAGFSAQQLREQYPELVLLSISDFGRTGPLQNWRATDPVLHALSGGLARSGIPGRPPLPPPASIATRSAAAQAAFAALLAFYARLRSGVGDWLDFSILDGVVQTLDPGFGIAGSAAAGVRASDLPRGRPDVRNQYPIIPCADGFIRLCVLSPRQWRGMFIWMGSPVEFADPSFEKLTTRFASPTLIPAIERFFAGKSRFALEAEGQEFGVPAAAVLTPEEAIDTEQNRARELFETLCVAGTDIRLPKCPIEIDGERSKKNDGNMDAKRDALFARKAATPYTPVGTLSGLRVLDMGVIVVGAETGRLFADAGADVVKIENAAFPDGVRQINDGRLMSPSFAAGHQNKRSLVLDLRSTAGKTVFLDLVAQADVLMSNFKPGTLDALGFDAATLCEANPRLILVESSAFGATGPQSRRLGYGPLVRAATGLSSAWSYPGEPASFSDAMTVYPDHVAARLGALAALALVVRRRRTDVGGTVRIAQAEVILDHLGVDMAVASVKRGGNAIEDPMPIGPWGIFPCAGDDAWCVVTVESITQRTALATVVGTGTPPVATDSIEADLMRWLSERSANDAMNALQAIGVPAAAMLRVSEMPDFAHFDARHFFHLVTHPELTLPFVVEARPVRASGLADPDHAPAPLMGQDSETVLRDWLGYSDEQIAPLVDDDVVGLSPRADKAALQLRLRKAQYHD